MSRVRDTFEGIEAERLVGRYGSEDSRGPLMLVTVAVHGNEPSGLHAARRVLARLEELAPRFRGEMVVVTGNVTALAKGVRFIERDLNRLFLSERISALREGQGPKPPHHEDAEMLALLDELEPRIEAAQAAGRKVFLTDMHTSSADGCPFITAGDTLRNRSFALRFPLPLILGLEEQLDGSLIEYLGLKGVVTIAAEAGQHYLESSVDHHEALLWFSLVAGGLMRASDLPELEKHRRDLEQATEGVERVMEVRHRHRIGNEDSFSMRPGFENFQPVRKGQKLAEDRHGPIRARSSGIVLLPLYQGLGDDGFFLGRAVGPAWLAFSSFLRRLGMPRIAHLLPGVRQVPDDNCLMMRIDTRVARYYPRELFFMLGFRKFRERGPVLYMSRRHWDASTPW